MVIVVLLWSYLDGGKGIHNAFPEELEHSVGARTLARDLKRAKALSLNTQTSDSGGFDRAKRTEAMGRVISRRVFSASN